MAKIENILFPTDFSECAEHALKYAIIFAQQNSAKLHLLHVVEKYVDVPLFVRLHTPASVSEEAIHNAMEDEARKQLSEIAERVGPDIETTISVPVGIAHQEIIEFAEQQKIDMIVIGTHGRTGLSHVLVGSVVERVVRLASCPVLTVRHP